MELSHGEGGLHCFPGEERTVTVSRLTNHREWLAKQK
jgi:hypothetical protein